MSYNPNTNTILAGDTEEAVANGMGQMFLRVTKDIAELPNAPLEIKEDWNVLKNWLECPEGEIDTKTYKKFGLAWQSYLALGVSPSADLKEAFASFEKAAIKESWPTISIPPEIKLIFDKMMALQGEGQATVKKKKEFQDLQQIKFDKERLTKVSAVLWGVFSIPVSEHLYDVALDHGFFMRIFALVIVAMPIWLLFGWRWVTENAALPDKAIYAICITAIVLSLIFLNDYHLRELFYIPVLEALVFVLLLSIKEKVALVEASKKAVKSLFSVSKK